jgi:hypothetical protein
MTCEKFVAIKFQPKTQAVLDQANAIIAEYEAQDFVLTLRQLFYQFVSRALVENTFRSYKRIGLIVNNGRLAGAINWGAIEDRTRSLVTHTSWDGPQEIIDAVADQYQEDPWLHQPYQPEVWIEKAALLGVIEGVCTEYRVPYFASIGNNSQSEQYKAGKRFARHLRNGRIPVVLLLTDHDPNGIDMERDNRERLAMFARQEIEVRRIALNMKQVRRYRPPPNFAKETDTRFADYAREFGEKCWELDALSPVVIANLIRTELDSMIDVKLWEQSMASEQRGSDLLGKVAGNWAKVRKALR